MKKRKWYAVLHMGLVLLLASSVVACGTMPASAPRADAPPVAEGPSVEQPPVIVFFSATPAEITAGTSATLQWNTARATIISIDQGVGFVPAAGTREVSPATTAAYTLAATNTAGTVTKSVTITVSPAPSGQPSSSAPPEESTPLAPPHESFVVWSDKTFIWVPGGYGDHTSVQFEGKVQNTHPQWSLKDVDIALVEGDRELARLRIAHTIRPGETKIYYWTKPLSSKGDVYSPYMATKLEWEWQPPISALPSEQK